MEEKSGGALTKKPVLDKESLRKRFFGHVHKTAAKRTIPESNDAQNAAQQTPAAHQKADKKVSDDRVTEDSPTTLEPNDALLEKYILKADSTQKTNNNSFA